MNKYAVCRYLATGNSFISLYYEYLLGATTVRETVRDTCDAIWECLKPALMSARDKMTGHAQPMNSTRRQIFRTA